MNQNVHHAAQSRDNMSLLSAGVAWIRLRLLRLIAQQQSLPSGEPAPDVAPTLAQLEIDLNTAERQWREELDADHHAALARLVKACGLSRFECDLLMLCIAAELDTGIHELCAAAQPPSHGAFPTPALALALLDDGAWDAFQPDRPLRDLLLIDVFTDDSVPWIMRRLRTDERVVAHVKGLDYLNATLGMAVDSESILGCMPCPLSMARLVERIAELIRASHRSTVQLLAADAATVRALACTVSREFDVELAEISPSQLPQHPAEIDSRARLWRREALMTPRVIVIHSADDSPAAQSAVRQLIERLVHYGVGPLLVHVPAELSDSTARLLALDVPSLPAAEQQALWEATVGPAHAPLAARLASGFDLSWGAILARGAQQVSADDPARLWSQCQAITRQSLARLAQRIETKATWKHLVLPDAQRQLLMQLTAQVRGRRCVWEEWGFAELTQRNLGVTALFAGEPGTGKTLAAEVLAGELGLDLYRIDLSAVVSKYIGETEKNLRRIFDAAATGGTLLLFDEADALFGRRSEVKDAHDRYANIEVNFLLQQMELYRGIAILATNQLDALDPAFLRRLRFVVRFPFPGPHERAAIWRSALPPRMPVGELDFDRLALLNLAGGSIHNIVLNAAFLAADEQLHLSMRHLQIAARAEFSKLGRPLDEAVFR